MIVVWMVLCWRGNIFMADKWGGFREVTQAEAITVGAFGIFLVYLVSRTSQN